MRRLFESYQIALSFFTVLPVVKHYEWTKERMRFVPFMMGVVGLIIGVLTASIYYLLSSFNFEYSQIIIPVVLVGFLTYISGGLHIDALMDTADSYFSRRSIERKLEIMTDSRVGAFAVIAFFFYMIVLLLTIYIYASMRISYLYIIFIPFFSRILTGLMNYRFKYAKKDGLARIYGESLKSKDQIFLIAFFFLVSVIMYYFNPNNLLSIFLIGFSILSYLYYGVFCKKNFGGITGDLLGNYIVLNELLLLILVVVINLWYL